MQPLSGQRRNLTRERGETIIGRLPQCIDGMEDRGTRGPKQAPGATGRRWLLPWLVLVVPLCCSSKEEIPFVSLSSGQNPASAVPQDAAAPLRIAVAPMVSAQGTATAYRAFIEYLSSKLGRPVALVQRRTYAEINELVRVGRVDLAFVCSGAYIEGHRRFGMELLAAPVVAGGSAYRSYIIINRGVHAGGFAELRGMRFAFTDVLSNTGFLYPTYLLRIMNEEAASFFSEVVFTNAHDRSIRAVAEHMVDAAAVDSLVYDQLAAADRSLATATRIIAQSSTFGIPPVVVHPALPAALKDRLRVILIGMHEDPAASAALASLGIDRFTTISDAQYDSVREVAQSALGQGLNG